MKYICQLHRLLLILVLDHHCSSFIDNRHRHRHGDRDHNNHNNSGATTPPPVQGPNCPKINIALYETPGCIGGINSVETIKQTQCFPFSSAGSIEAGEFYRNECNPSTSGCNLVTYSDANCQNAHPLQTALIRGPVYFLKRTGL